MFDAMLEMGPQLDDVRPQGKGRSLEFDRMYTKRGTFHSMEVVGSLTRRKKRVPIAYVAHIATCGELQVLS